MRVHWFDCTFADVQMEADDALREDLIEMQTVGHMVGRNDKLVCIGADYIEQQECYRHMTWIPLVNIRRIEMATEMGEMCVDG